MGSTTFENVFYGEKDASAKEAYSQLVSDALYESGHDGYNGTISTTSGVNPVAVAPMTLADAVALAETRIERLEKWGPCEAIPLVEETPAEYAGFEPVTVTATVSGAVLNDRALLVAELARVLKIKARDIDEAGQIRADKISVEKKIDAVAPKEKAVTRYFVVTAQSGLPAWESGFATQAEARAAVGGLLTYSPWGGIRPVEAEVIGITRRESGAPLVSATVSAKKVTATFSLNLRRVIKPAKAGTKRVGWYFYGWAAC